MPSIRLRLQARPKGAMNSTGFIFSAPSVSEMPRSSPSLAMKKIRPRALSMVGVALGVLGHSQSGRPITLRFLSLAEHLDVIFSAREVCESVYAADPDSRGMALLAGQFTDTDRIDYLDKA